MSKNGYFIIDSDLHVAEPSDLWQRYLDPSFRERAPAIVRASPESRVGYYLFEGLRFPDVDRAEQARYVAMSRRMDEATARMRKQGFDASSQLEAMDLEGVDVAVLYPTVALHIPLGVDGVDPQLSAAVCRAYNN